MQRSRPAAAGPSRVVAASSLVARVATPLVVVALGACAAAGGVPSGSTADATTRTVRVAAASDLVHVLDDLAGTLEGEGIEVEATYASSGTLLQQVRNGAPYDLYLAADVAYARLLADEGLATDDGVFTYATARLAVWVPAATDRVAGLDALLHPEVRTVAVANPRHAPYGAAAVAAIDDAGLTSAVEAKLVLGESTAQAAEMAAAGHADAAVVALSVVLADARAQDGSWAEVPPAAGTALEQGGVVLASARDVDAAAAVRDALLSDEGRTLLERHGLGLPGR
ncbi:molybdate ABC transporter substrate-binding protein [Cellulomonas carbonis]|uniref:Molybdenum ABC transporter substrate-binding protein n=1 Tax=Cellulomonas carbonis T26 TaxID=947969 RepID=A0A0A0BKG1_9CELL|nr:molybdate ABC transporter substrate-binding protein [Cellulomonas carbonis]KGM09013.1 molybdenum ABC transporter substrate-binding protein [Cellulomonas carbonis T26]